MSDKCLESTCRNPATWCGYCVKEKLQQQLHNQRQAIGAYLAGNPTVPASAIEAVLSGEFKYTTTTGDI